MVAESLLNAKDARNGVPRKCTGIIWGPEYVRRAKPWLLPWLASKGSESFHVKILWDMWEDFHHTNFKVKIFFPRLQNFPTKLANLQIFLGDEYFYPIRDISSEIFDEFFARWRTFPMRKNFHICNKWATGNAWHLARLMHVSKLDS